jgi:hypothetical protein
MWFAVTHAGGLFVSVSFTGSTTGVMTSGTFLSAPDAPAQPTVAAGDGEATITVGQGAGAGGAPTSYTVTADPGGHTCTVTGASGACTITSLTNGQAYTFTATATNSTGTSTASAASAAATPTARAQAAPAATTTENAPAATAIRAPTFTTTVTCNRTVACTTVGTVPVGATRVVQVATSSLLRGARSSTRVAIRCPITTRDGIRCYRCELRLGAGAWTIATRALNGNTVITQTIRRVKLATPAAVPVTG